MTFTQTCKVVEVAAKSPYMLNIVLQAVIYVQINRLLCFLACSFVEFEVLKSGLFAPYLIPYTSIYRYIYICMPVCENLCVGIH